MKAFIARSCFWSIAFFGLAINLSAAEGQNPDPAMTAVPSMGVTQTPLPSTPPKPQPIVKPKPVEKPHTAVELPRAVELPAPEKTLNPTTITSASAPAALDSGAAVSRGGGDHSFGCWMLAFAMLIIGIVAGFAGRHLMSRHKLGGMSVRIGTWRGIP